MGSLARIETAGDRMVIHEDDGSIEVPLTAAWTVVDPSLSASAAQLADGTLAIDLAFLATPHRLEIELDPSTHTFATHWPSVPLFAAGLANQLTSFRAPAD